MRAASADQAGVGARSGLGIAAKNRVPIYRLTSANYQNVLQHLALPTALVAEVSEAVQSGAIVTIPQSAVEIGGWRGFGYIIERTAGQSTSASYDFRISGGSSGGVLIPSNGIWDIEDITSAVKFVAGASMLQTSIAGEFVLSVVDTLLDVVEGILKFIECLASVEDSYKMMKTMLEALLVMAVVTIPINPAIAQSTIAILWFEFNFVKMSASLLFASMELATDGPECLQALVDEYDL